MIQSTLRQDRLAALAVESYLKTAEVPARTRESDKLRRRLLALLLEMPKAPNQSEAELWPAEVDLILSAMDAAPHPPAEERRSQRMAYRVRADLHLFADGENAAPWTLYTRDVDPRGLGFITRHRLPLGYGGWIELLAPNGRKQRIAATLYRCREVVPGWFEGALYFNREQYDFVAED